MPSTVFVSGASGFIAQHVVKYLLAKSYNVIGSVRSNAKGDNLTKLFSSPKFSYEVVADVAVEGAFDEALEKHPEVSVFLHTASPFHYSATDFEKEILIPAIKGTENAFKSIKSHGKNVKHVVVTSSVAAVTKLGDNGTYNESDWNPITYETALGDANNAYRGSKKFAEKAAWDFIKANDPVPYTINFVLPTFVFGPQAYASEITDSLNTSSEMINALLKSKASDKVPSTSANFCDVRDVAQAHLDAFEKDFNKERLLINSGQFTSQKILDIINDNFAELKGRIPLGTPGDYSNQLIAPTLDNSRTKNLLGYPFVDLKTCIVDSVLQLLDAKK